METKLKEKLDKLLEKTKRKLQAAERLYEDGFYDDSISRAYYAMYQVAIALLMTKDLTPKTHSGVLTMLSLHFVKTGIVKKKYFDMFAHAKEARENGDYEAFYMPTKEEARLVLRNAKQFIDEIERILKKNMEGDVE